MPAPKSKNLFSLNKKKVESFCKKHRIAFLALFGSILTPHFTDKSDIDVVVKFEKGSAPNFFELVDMESELSSMLGRRVDLKTPNDLSPYFRDEVLAAAKKIYGKYRFSPVQAHV